MNRKLLDLSGQIDREALALLTALGCVASQQKVSSFLVGAYARDLIFNAHGINTHRATVDIDLAVRVSSWNRYERLRKGLLALGDFQETRQRQRLLFRDTLPLDLVPFGQIAQPDESISWPRDHEAKMDVAGFEDAFHCSHLVRISTDPILEIRVASPIGLAILKLSSWRDREAGREKDAIDLLLILRNYLDLENPERLWDEHPDIASGEEFDYERAGARLLGRDISAAATPETAKILTEVIANQTSPESGYALVLDMLKGRPTPGFEDALALLLALLQGLNDSRQ